MTLQEMLEMKLHQLKVIDDIEILRVPGGWIYTKFGAFVPEPKQYQYQYENDYVDQ